MGAPMQGFVLLVASVVAGPAIGPGDAWAQQIPPVGGAESWWEGPPPAPGEGKWMRLGMRQGRRTQWLASVGDRLVWASSPTLPNTRWFVRAWAPNLVRLESWSNQQVRALGLDESGVLRLQSIGAEPTLYWRIVPAGASGWALQNVGRPEFLLGVSSGRPAAVPWSVAGPVMWLPTFVPAPIGIPAPLRIVSTRLIPNPPAPPVTLELFNGNQNELWVLISDSRQPSHIDTVAIAPGDSIQRVVQRDPGATLVEEVELRTAFGTWQRQRLEMQIPSALVLDLSVYEKFLQSVAIDATGKSPNRIEDVNYVPKSVGRFSLLIDDSVPETVRVDVYERAVAAKNPGAVLKMDPRQWDEPQGGSSPLERALQPSQPPQRRRF
ncbi:MAG: hypothetical protein D6753_16870 [Planctomycetota bacterium]|nr:MAG: hypothetical protein D6753_16870 [Planctomycetota bacterium]